MYIYTTNITNYNTKTNNNNNNNTTTTTTNNNNIYTNTTTNTTYNNIISDEDFARIGNELAQKITIEKTEFVDCITYAL